MKAEEFGIYIRELRNQRNLSIRQLELYSGVSNSYLSQLENGKRETPSPEILKKLAGPLKTSHLNLMIAAGHIENEDSDEEEFQKVISDPELKRWYSELPNSDEKDLRKLRKMWEIIKNEDK
ncbi:transcriptional regulator [Sporosarcina sp. P2]|uniref:helix-turn-helix domain-containing protein n=1 Tax=Sporosarcina sp. P2 TaxID=2048251 RepID=UPI000C1671C6|nr:helix-turn-helix domain-containing protein [Sporosarcina sp. P2]PID03806.1 transcriptional regulator [Sporosarcina sp. P2]